MKIDKARMYWRSESDEWESSKAKSVELCPALVDGSGEEKLRYIKRIIATAGEVE